MAGGGRAQHYFTIPSDERRVSQITNTGPNRATSHASARIVSFSFWVLESFVCTTLCHFRIFGFWGQRLRPERTLTLRPSAMVLVGNTFLQVHVMQRQGSHVAFLSRVT